MYWITLKETYKIFKLHLIIYSCQALLASPNYHKAKEKDRALLDSYASYVFLSYDSQSLLTNQTSSIELLKLRGEAGHTYFSNPAYLDLVEAKFASITS